MNKICLVMIVKNESAVLRACLESVVDHVDFAMIVDTGSTEAEDERCRKIIGSVFGAERDQDWHYPGTEWRDFAYNRTDAMRRAEAHFSEADYLLVIDADDRLEDSPNHILYHGLTADAYHLQIVHGNITFPRLQLFKADGLWHYRGVVHEFPVHPLVKAELGTLDWKVQTSRGGARSADPKKYEKDALALYVALEHNEEPELKSRYTFYLAQSLRDSGNDEAAIKYYFERTKLDGYVEERYISYLEMGRALLRMGKLDGAVDACAMASKVCPHRLEAAHTAARALREAGRFADALEVCRAHPNRAIWAGTLFAEPAVYAYAMDDEHSVSAYWSNAHREALNYAMCALEGYTDLDIDTRRMIGNVRFCLIKNGFSDAEP